MKKFFYNIKEKNTLIFFFLLILIFVIAFDPSRGVDKKILASYDKIKHIFAFMVLSYFLFESSINLHKYFKILILVCIAFSIEYVQAMIGRESSVVDFIASISGIFIYLFIKFMFKKFRNDI